MEKIYLDYAATTPIDQRIIQTMLPYFENVHGNPSSVHVFGQEAEKALDEARTSIANDLGVDHSEIIFTSCGSESDNLAIRGTAFARREKYGHNHILISPIEHPAVQVTAEQLASHFGFEVSYLEVDRYGEVKYDFIEQAIREDTALVSIMAANNEIGTINDLKKIGDICKASNIPLHTDAVQSAAHFSYDLNELDLDLMSLGAHKFYGPKGVGILYLRKGTEILPMTTGGSQEYGIRAATQNIPLIMGMAKALNLVRVEGAERRSHLTELRDLIIAHVLDVIPGSQLTGSPTNRLPNHASFVFENLDGNLLIQVLDSEGFACSSGSACKTGDPKPSSVLTSLGYTPDWALGSLRVSLGKDTTRDEVDKFLEKLPSCVQRVRDAG